jgi:hypothetical protein
LSGINRALEKSGPPPVHTAGKLGSIRNSEFTTNLPHVMRQDCYNVRAASNKERILLMSADAKKRQKQLERRVASSSKVMQRFPSICSRL